MVGSRFRTWVVGAVIALLAWAPSAAQAARPGVLIATGEAPSVAIDAAGNAYIAYNDEPPGENDEPVGLCVIPHGARGCASNRDVLIDGMSGEAQPALVSATGDGQVSIVSNRCCFGGDQEIASTDGGATFSAPVTIGSDGYFDGAFGPAGQALLIDDIVFINGIYAQVGSVSAPASTDALLFNPPPGISAVGGWSGSIPVVVAEGTDTQAAYWTGAGDVNDAENWNNISVRGSTSDPSLASGPKGLYLLMDTGAGGGRLVVRKFTGNGFGAAHIVHVTSSTEGTAFAEDPSGDLIAAWWEDGTMYAAASRDGVHFTRPRVIGTDVALPGRMNAALGADGTGWLVYEDNGGGSVRAIPLDAAAMLGIHRTSKHHHHRRHHHRRHHHRRHRRRHHHHR